MYARSVSFSISGGNTARRTFYSAQQEQKGEMEKKKVTKGTGGIFENETKREGKREESRRPITCFNVHPFTYAM